jgi:hypothetical protein
MAGEPLRTAFGIQRRAVIIFASGHQAASSRSRVFTFFCFARIAKSIVPDEASASALRIECVAETLNPSSMISIARFSSALPA